jgi:hypothetical protein
MNPEPQGSIADSDEPPRLHQPDARREICGGEQSVEQRRIDGLARKMPHVAPSGHHPVERVDFFRGEIFNEYVVPRRAPAGGASAEIIARSTAC